MSKGRKNEKEEEPELRATGRAKKSSAISNYIDNVQSRFREKASGTVLTGRRSFSKSNLVCDKDAITNAVEDARSDKTGICLRTKFI